MSQSREEDLELIIFARLSSDLDYLNLSKSCFLDECSKPLKNIDDQYHIMIFMINILDKKNLFV